MQNPGRGRRNAAIGFALALVALCGFGTTSAQASDELTIVSPETSFQIGGLVNETGGRAIRLGIRYGASGPHLTPGSQVRLRPAPTAEFPSAADIVITVPMAGARVRRPSAWATCRTSCPRSSASSRAR